MDSAHDAEACTVEQARAEHAGKWRGNHVQDWRVVAGPVLFFVVAAALLIYDHVQGKVAPVVFWLGIGLIFLVFSRALLTIRDNAEALASQTDAFARDAVTGLGNEDQLRSALAAALAADEGRHVLLMLELDGLQGYKDRFGHRQGDELLRRLTDRLTAAVTPFAGETYRMGAARLCVVAPEGPQAGGELVAATTASLDDHDRDLLLGNCYGLVTLPHEAADPELALQEAGRRLEIRKQRQHGSTRRQAHAVLVAVLDARRPDLRDHLRAVTPRVIAVGHRLGLERDELDDIVLAAALQDIGLLTVPEATLEKSTPLDARERELVRAHPLAGERIIAAASELAPVAALVRTACERYDGTGYPDGLAGDKIPAGSRIIAACVALAAMTARRPHRSPLSPDDAIAELRRGAGSQFDPEVVEALIAELTEEMSPLPSGGAATR